MARVSTISLLLWILSLGLLGSVADARETMGEKARRLRGRSPRPRRVRTDDPVDNDYRFMTNATSSTCASPDFRVAWLTLHRILRGFSAGYRL
jgi:hypothetical protein